ncbi:MAG: hypothetical protein RKH07_11215 [Gammaproteobacteria bacterium]
MSDKDSINQDGAESRTENSNDFQFAQPAPVASNKPPAWMWIGVGVLSLLALAVIFVLPGIVSEYELPLERRSDVATSRPAQQTEPVSTISPFEEAQRARQRKEAQDILATLLEHQDELDALEVASWAPSDYETALEQASIGDEYYRMQDFVNAANFYVDARDQLQDLLARVPQVMETTLAEGQSALAAGESGIAEDKFSLALLFDPESAAAQQGLERARSLDEVNSLFADADQLAEDGEFSAARDVYRQIASLDSYNEQAQARIDDMSAAIREAEFSRVMSRGYTLLDAGNPEEAIAAFEEAADLGVNAEQAQAAIVQTENEVANAQINALRERISEAEANEQWQQAVDLYDEVLAIDPNLLFATQGKDYAGKRAQLDRLLVYANDNPERFADPAVYQETIDVYYTGRGIENPGPVLTSQLNELESLLEVSQIPIDVRFVSDNFTDVVLLRHGELGLFEQKTLTLKPGRYVAVGSRAGYREVREEFVVGYGQTPEAVVLRCEERVVATSR